MSPPNTEIGIGIVAILAPVFGVLAFGSDVLTGGLRDGIIPRWVLWGPVIVGGIFLLIRGIMRKRKGA